MFFTKKAPVQLETGEIFNPESWNENLTYTKAAISDVANREIMRWTSHYSLCPTVGTALTPSTLIDYRKIGIPPQGDRNGHAIGGSPTNVDVYIESIAINAFYTATSPFTLNIYGETENIVITFPERDASLATVPYNIVELANIVADRGGDLLLLDVLPTGTSITKLDITVGFASNKYECGNITYNFFNTITATTKPDIDSLTFAREVTDGDVLNASTFSQLKTDLQNAAAAAVSGSPVRWAHTQMTFYSSNSGRLFASLGAFQKPAFVKNETAPQIVGIYACGYNVIASIGNTFFDICDNTGTVIFSAATGILGLGTNAFTASNFPNINTAYKNIGNPNSLADDWYISSYITGASNVVNRTDIYILFQ